MTETVIRPGPEVRKEGTLELQKIELVACYKCYGITHLGWADRELGSKVSCEGSASDLEKGVARAHASFRGDKAESVKEDKADGGEKEGTEDQKDGDKKETGNEEKDDEKKPGLLKRLANTVTGKGNSGKRDGGRPKTRKRKSPKKGDRK